MHRNITQEINELPDIKQRHYINRNNNKIANENYLRRFRLRNLSQLIGLDKRSKRNPSGIGAHQS